MSIAVAVLAAAAMLAAGAVAAAAVYPPGSVSLPTRLAAVFGLGYAVAALTPTLLVLAHVFVPAVTVAALLIVVAGLAVAARRRCPPRALAADLRSRLHADTAALATGLVVVAAIAVARLGVAIDPIHGAWRYWADGLELADVGHIPAATLQWGAFHPPTVSKLVGNAFTGELSFAFAAHPFAGMAVGLWLSVVGYSAGLWALGWELGLRRTAPLLPVLGVAGAHLPLGVALNADSIAKLTFFQDEDMGRAVAVIAAAMAIPALRGAGGRTAAVAAGLVLAAGALTHAIPAGVMAAFLVAYAALMLVRSDRRRQTAVAAAVTLAMAAVAAAALLAVAGGDIGLEGGSGGNAYVLFNGRFDPTAYADNRFLLPRPKSRARWYEAPTTTVRQLVAGATGKTPHGWMLVAVLAVALAATAAVAVWGPAQLRLAVLAAAALEAVILLVALEFSYRQSYYVPATFGERRLFEYASIPVMLILLAVVEIGLDRLGGFGPKVPVVVAAALVVAVVAVAGPGQLRGDLQTSSATADYITAARIATPCNARILVTAPSKGAFQALTGRADILEGMAPFLRPAILRTTVRLVHLGRQYLAQPITHAGFLAREHVDAVLVGRGKGAGWRAFDHAPNLEPVRTVGMVRVYRYTGPGAGTGGVRPDDAPGYTCRRTPLS